VLARGRGTLVLTGHGVENGSAVDVRTTLTLEPGRWTQLRETRRAGEAFSFRHRYALGR
jgi:hypothetical protein